jgi:hypothetical protein
MSITAMSAVMLSIKFSIGVLSAIMLSVLTPNKSSIIYRVTGSVLLHFRPLEALICLSLKQILD